MASGGKELSSEVAARPTVGKALWGREAQLHERGCLETLPPTITPTEETPDGARYS